MPAPIVTTPIKPPNIARLNATAPKFRRPATRHFRVDRACGYVSSGDSRNSQLAQSLARLQRLWRARITLNQALQLGHPVILFAEFEQRESLLQLCRRCLVPAREVLQHLIVALHGLLVISLLELDLSQIEIRISREIGVGIVLDVVGKLLQR